MNLSFPIVIICSFIASNSLQCMDDVELNQTQPHVPGFYQQVADAPLIAPQPFVNPDVAVRIPQVHVQRLQALLRPEREKIVEKQHEIFEEHKLIGTSNGMSKMYLAITAFAAANAAKDTLISFLNNGSNYYYPLAALASTLMLSGSTMCAYNKRKETAGHMRSLTNLIDQRNHLVLLGDTIHKKCETACNISALVGKEKSALYGGSTALMCLILLSFKDVSLCISDPNYIGTIDMYSFWANMFGIMCMTTIAVESCGQSNELEFTNLQAELDQLILHANEQ